jgi:hypothetical protein
MHPPRFTIKADRWSIPKLLWDTCTFNLCSQLHWPRTPLGSMQVAVRRAAAAVLGDIAIPDVVEPLAKVALNDSDERVSFLAVRGLALATSAAEAPSTATFRERPDEILQFWRLGRGPTSVCREWQRKFRSPSDSANSSPRIRDELRGGGVSVQLTALTPGQQRAPQ